MLLITAKLLPTVQIYLNQKKIPFPPASITSDGKKTPPVRCAVRCAADWHETWWYSGESGAIPGSIRVTSVTSSATVTIENNETTTNLGELRYFSFLDKKGGCQYQKFDDLIQVK